MTCSGLRDSGISHQNSSVLAVNNLELFLGPVPSLFDQNTEVWRHIVQEVVSAPPFTISYPYSPTGFDSRRSVKWTEPPWLWEAVWQEERNVMAFRGYVSLIKLNWNCSITHHVCLTAKPSDLISANVVPVWATNRNRSWWVMEFYRKMVWDAEHYGKYASITLLGVGMFSLLLLPFWIFPFKIFFLKWHDGAVLVGLSVCK